MLESSTTLQISCQCGHISFPSPSAKPLDLYFCHCTECRAQSASAFGTSAIFPSSPLFPLSNDLKSKLRIWSRQSSKGTTKDCYFCPECGVRIMHINRPLPDGTGGETVSIKGGVIQGLEWNGAKHIWCRSAVVPIPDGAERWEMEPDED